MNKFISLLTLGFMSHTSVFAQAAPAAGGTDWSPLLGIGLMIGVFFFLIILPQSRKAKKHAEFLASLKKGDAIVTATGIFGRIYGLADKVVTLEIAQNVRIRIDRVSW
jgi:preprotein translocase subunit YajC